jgi:hypothetical protein
MQFLGGLKTNTATHQRNILMMEEASLLEAILLSWHIHEGLHLKGFN